MKEILNEANKCYSSKDYEKAIKLYEECIGKNYELFKCNYNIGNCHIRTLDYKKAIQFLKESLAHKTDSRSYFNIGYCQSMIGDLKQAYINFNIAWSLDNDDKECEKAINLILEKLNYKKTR